MTTILCRLTDLSDTQLIAELRTLSERERDATVQLIACLGEVDARRLYLAESCSSLFTYCTRVLPLSEHAAYGRIEAARAARRFPVILDRLAQGAVTLTTICLLAPHLTSENHVAVLDSARHKTKREVEKIVASLHPAPPTPPSVRKLPTPVRPLPVNDAERAPVVAPVGSQSIVAPELVAAPPPRARPAAVVPTAPEQFQIKMTISRETHDKLRRAQDLIRHVVPNADPAVIFDRALTVLLKELEKARFALAERPRAARASARGSRHVAAAVRREVWARDGGQCAFVGTNGRCTERGFLEFHHVVPFADGGDTTAANLELRCRAHNAYEADEHFRRTSAQESCSVWTELPAPPTCAGSKDPAYNNRSESGLS